MTQVLMRVDAARGVGLGHLQRCLALASALRQVHTSCVFLTNGEDSITERVRRFGFEARPFNEGDPGGESDWRQVLDLAAAEGCDAVVVDSYLVDERYLSQLRTAGLLVAAIDDLARFPFPCHLVVSGGAGAESLPYRSSTGDTRFLLGPKYALLREEFWEVAPRSNEGEVREVLVTMGGADGRNLTPVVLQVLDSLDEDFGVTAVIGPLFRDGAAVEEIAKQCRRPVRLVHSPDCVLDLMLEADLAITAGGQTTLELAATGTPAVAIKTAENQADNIRCLAQHGCISAIEYQSRDQLRTALSEETARLLRTPEERKRMGRAGQGLIDGLGAMRAGEALAEILAGSPEG